jgi:ATP-dependent Clp protease ATP-binding subunit ClpA
MKRTCKICQKPIKKGEKFFNGPSNRGPAKHQDCARIGNDFAEIPKHANLMLTPRLQQTLTRAALEAEKLGDTYIGTEHILLAMLALEQGNAWRVMHAAGLEYKSAKFALTVMKST